MINGIIKYFFIEIAPAAWGIKEKKQASNLIMMENPILTRGYFIPVRFMWIAKIFISMG